LCTRLITTNKSNPSNTGVCQSSILSTYLRTPYAHTKKKNKLILATRNRRSSHGGSWLWIKERACTNIGCVVTLYYVNRAVAEQKSTLSHSFSLRARTQVIRKTGLCWRDHRRSWHPHLIYAASHAADPQFFERPRRSWSDSKNNRLFFFTL
jgi:hypothetical protein